MTQFARFVHGPAAGRVIEVNGDRHQVADMEPVDFANEITVKVTTYEVHEFRYQSGHKHFYAAPHGVSPAGLFNEMWHGYQTTQSLRNQVAELEEQNRRLAHDLHRETFKNQFGEYPA